jgi:phosphoglycerate kinase
MCFPFLAAQGHAVGASRGADDDVELAGRTLGSSDAVRAEVELPVDLVLGDRQAADARVRHLDGVEVPEGWIGLDIGSRTAERYAELIVRAGTVFWNGPMGMFEFEPFAAGTRTVATAVADAPGITIVGGGDSVAALTQLGLTEKVMHVSTGGGASLELIEGKRLPGVEVLA